MKRASVLVGSLLLPGIAACSQAGEEVAERVLEQQTGGDVEVDEDGITAKDEQGNEVSIGGGAQLPDTWPGAVPTPEDATLQTAFSSAQEGAATGLWLTSRSQDDAMAAYDDQLRSAGFALDEEVDLGIGQTRAYTGSGGEVTVVAGDGGDGSSTLTVAVRRAA